ncbi:exopolysaccharide biosynthesis protein [Fodinicurvata fenggangensis]|uniref:exopolysaccharide biosynthesis protein n=1 Tax=Fodinicurvata fenggangensis TaxID=1121830 RepID=UPI0005513562|nr:exopolysaccharide biosynthesis protein [Fodinicurvata fenggangensis]
MPANSQPSSLQEMLERMETAGSGSAQQVSVDELMDAVGYRSFGPLLLLIALIAMSPLGGIPGVPTLFAFCTIAVAGQLLVNQKHLWLPNFILRRSVEQEKLSAFLERLRPMARRVDAIARPRLTHLISGPGLKVAALCCILVALTVPPLEVVPFAAVIVWLAIGAFGLSVILQDGAIALVGLAIALGGGLALVTGVL